MGSHIIDGEFQSDKYPACPRGKVPLSVRDPSAQDLLWEYARRRRVVDAEFSDDLDRALVAAGYAPPSGRRSAVEEAIAAGHLPQPGQVDSAEAQGAPGGALAMVSLGHHHDQAMTRGPWRYDGRLSIVRDGSHGDGEVWEIAEMRGEALLADEDGIPWMRNNLRALLDACESALAEADRLRVVLARSSPEVDLTGAVGIRLEDPHGLALLRAGLLASRFDGARSVGVSGEMAPDDVLALRAALLKIEGIEYSLRVDGSGRYRIDVADVATRPAVDGGDPPVESRRRAEQSSQETHGDRRRDEVDLLVSRSGSVRSVGVIGETGVDDASALRTALCKISGYWVNDVTDVAVRSAVDGEDLPEESRRRADQVYRDACKQEGSYETRENHRRDLVAALGIAEGSAQSTDWVTMLTRVACLAAEVARLGSLLPVCAQCGELPAECVGIYDGEPGEEPRASCGGCCGHGGEDGWCVAISDLPGWVARRESRSAGRIADWLERGSSRGVVPDSATASAIAQAIRSGSWRDGSAPR